MGRHHKPSATSRLSRLALCTGAVGVGVLQMTAPAIAAPSSAPAAPQPSSAPCEKTARACVALSAHKAWLMDGKGHVTYGAVPITSGAKGQETPTGVFSVQWKDQHHRSSEYHNAPMENSVFFFPGDAFHDGSLQRESAGCVHLSTEASKKFFDTLQVGDEVQVLP